MRVLLGISGGVDSSVAALLLQKQGYEVIGVTMVLWQNDTNCQIVKDAKSVCEQLKIEHHVVEFKNQFKKHVIENFINCYRQAKTPNPCVECNKHIKFGALYEKAIELNCDYIATGHYAKVEFDEKYNHHVLKMSSAEKKDQTYFLYGIKKEILPKILFPLESFTDKTEIRQIAEKEGLVIAKKPDSQEICFIPNDDYVAFLQENMGNIQSGEITTASGEVLGKHNGIINYTVGQRKGLGIAFKEPLYVTKLDAKYNKVIVGSEEKLYSKIVEATNVNYLVNIDTPTKVKAKIRYRAKAQEGILTKINKDKVIIEFNEPVKAVTPGQSIVFYDEDIVLGGGIIV